MTRTDVQPSRSEQALEGTAVLVTGGGSGIGLTCAQRFAADGAWVTICGRSRAKLVRALPSLGDRGRYVVADVSDEAAMVEAADQAASAAGGGLTAVVANAGGTHALGPLALTSAKRFEQDLAVNVTGTFLTVKATAPHLARVGGGAIVAVSSVAGQLSHRLMGAYSTSKAAVDMLVRNAADELGPYGIRVNGVRPGLVPTGGSDPLASDPAIRDDYLAQMPLGRLGTVDDVASAVRFLAGPESSWITGQLLGVDGGHGLRRGPELSSLLPSAAASALTELLGPTRQKTV